MSAMYFDWDWGWVSSDSDDDDGNGGAFDPTDLGPRVENVVEYPLILSQHERLLLFHIQPASRMTIAISLHRQWFPCSCVNCSTAPKLRVILYVIMIPKICKGRIV